MGAGAFATDYPPSTPDAPARYSTRGALHDLFSAPTFTGLSAAALSYARASLRSGDRSRAACPAGFALVMLTGLWLASAAFSQVPSPVNRGGLFQRACVITEFAWLTAIAARHLRQ